MTRCRAGDTLLASVEPHRLPVSGNVVGRACSQKLRALLVVRAGRAPTHPPPAPPQSANCADAPSAVWHRSVTRARARAGLQEVQRRLTELVELSERDMHADDSLLLEGRGLLERLSQQIRPGGGGGTGAGGGARGQSASGDSGEALLEQGRCLLRRARGRV